MSALPVASNMHRGPALPAIYKGVTSLLIMNDGSAHTSAAFAAATTMIMVIVALKGIYFDIGPSGTVSSSSLSPRAGYLGVGSYYFGVTPGHVFTGHQEDGTANVTVIEGL